MAAHTDCQRDGWVSECEHMSVIMQGETSEWGCEMSSECLPHICHPPTPALQIPFPFILMLQGYSGCSAFTLANKLPHQACGPLRQTVKPGAPLGPRAHSSCQKSRGSCWRREGLSSQHVRLFLESHP